MTEFRCGGVALALTMCHTFGDGFGMTQLFKCIIDLARGETLPTVLTTWKRHLLVSSSKATSSEADVNNNNNDAKARTQSSIMTALEGMVTRSFLFGPREIAALQSGVPALLGGSATVFDLITAVMWRCRTAALEYAPHEQVYVVFLANARGSWMRNPSLPPGYYGNVHFTTVAYATAEELSNGPLAHAVGLVRLAKLRMTDTHVQAVLDLIARGQYNDGEGDPGRTFMVSDITRGGDDSLDLGWAACVGAGVSMAGDIITRLVSFYMICKDTNSEACVIVPVVLPEPAMGRFTARMAVVTRELARSSL